MSEHFTSLTANDRDTLLAVCAEAVRDKRLAFLEVGSFGGATARGIKAWADQNEIALDYTGIDSGQHPGFNKDFQPGIPFLGAKFVHGDSAEVHSLIQPEAFNIVFIDGCHCFNHVVLDTIHYARKVKEGGYLVFHDTDVECQKLMRDPHGPDNHWFHNSVLHAHMDMGWPWDGWVLTHSCKTDVPDSGDVMDERRKRTIHWGGIKAYRRTPGEEVKAKQMAAWENLK